MITGFLMKIVIGLAVLGFAVIELGSPLIVRAQIDGVAHDAADAAGFELRSRGSADAARAEAERVAAENDAVLLDFTQLDQFTVKVKVQKEARSFLLKKWSTTRDWYLLDTTATSQRGTG
jgi:hypothetical protein